MCPAHDEHVKNITPLILYYLYVTVMKGLKVPCEQCLACQRWSGWFYSIRLNLFFNVDKLPSSRDWGLLWRARPHAKNCDFVGESSVKCD